MNPERLMKIIQAPHVSEKSTLVAEKQKQFVFKVLLDATKPEIKQAIEKLFNVKVSDVCVCVVKGKRKMFKQKPGRRKDWKKAYVSLAEGYDISFAGTE